MADERASARGTVAAGIRPARRPLVVMFLANTFTHDTRVYKEARSLIEWGCDVVVLAALGGDTLPVEVQDGIRIERHRERFADLLFAAPALLTTAAWCGARSGPDAVAGRSWPHRTVLLLRKAINLALSGLVLLIGAALEVLLWPFRRGWNLGRLIANWVAKSVSAAIVRFVRRVHLCPANVRRGFRQFFLFMLLGRLIALSARLANRAARCTSKVHRNCLQLFMFMPLGRLIALNARLARRAARLQADVYHAHDLNMLLAGLLARGADGKLIYDSHELYLERNRGYEGRSPDRLFWSPLESFGIRRCDAVCSVAESICVHLEKQYGIPRPFLLRNVQPYEPPSSRTRLLSRELGLPDATAVVLYAGAVTFNRGLESMVEGAVLLDRAAYVIMGFAGNPEYLAGLKSRAGELGVLGSKIYFREAVPMNEVVKYVASADISIVPTQNVCLSYYYEASNKIFHSIMAGVPLAMSDHAEKRILVERYGVGELFDETDPRNIAECVNRMLADPAGLERMRRNCLAAARELNWECEEHRLRQVYAGMLGAAAPQIPPVPDFGVVPTTAADQLVKDSA